MQWMEWRGWFFFPAASFIYTYIRACRALRVGSRRGSARLAQRHVPTPSVGGSINIIMLKHMKMLRNNAIVGNIEHFDHEIFMVTLESMQGVKCQNVESQVDR